MAECAEVRLDLDAFLHGELSPARAAEIGDHLAGCASCSVELESFEMVGRSLARERERHKRSSPMVIVVPSKSTSRRRGLGALLAIAAIWAVVASAALLWPLAEGHLSWLPPIRITGRQDDSGDRFRVRAERAEAELREAEKRMAESTLALLPVGARDALLELLAAGGDTGGDPLRTLFAPSSASIPAAGPTIEMQSVRASTLGPSGMRLAITLGIQNATAQGATATIVVDLQRARGGWRATLVEGTWPPPG